MANILDGIKVVEVASFVAGPAAATQLSDFGAEVIKVEPPEGDMWRMANRVPPFPLSKIPYTHLLANRNKKSVALNLKSPEAQQVLYKLVAEADVFLTNSMPHVCAHLGISYEQIKEVNPRIVYAIITGFGEKGPDADSPGFDCTSWWARSGLMNTIRAKGGEPVNLPAAMGDHNTATALFAAVMTGLYQRERTGKGCRVSTSLLANGAWTNTNFTRLGLHSGFGISTILPRVVGQQNAAMMMLLGRRLKGAEAFKIGLADQLVATQEEVRPAALALATELATWSAPLAVQNTRETLRRGGSMGLLPPKYWEHLAKLAQG